MRRRSLRRLGIFGLGVGVGLSVLVGAAAAEPDEDNPSSAKYECSDSHHSDTDHGANDDDGYQSTCDETDFGGNGQEDGPGNQTGKPCAGCVGNADDKNPPGQYPDGSDDNSGYECDGRDRPSANQQGNGNHGIGDENPAHTGCEGSTTTQEDTCPDGTALPTTDVDGDGDIDDDDCSVDDGDTCPDGSALPTTDRDGNGTVNRADCRVDEDDDDDDDDDTRTSRTEVLSGELQASPTSGPGPGPGELAFTDDGAPAAPGAAPALATLPRTGAGDLNARLLALGAAFLLLGGVLVRVGRPTGAATP
jgi:hypothetical protein